MIAVLESNNSSTRNANKINPTVRITTKKLKDFNDTYYSPENDSRFSFVASDMTTAPTHHSDTSSVYTVVLQPENSALKTRHLELRADDNRIKIGRQISARTVPHKHNGYFDSKVLSRQHAELYCTEGKVFIRDTKSSNGTFVNGERLSEEGKASTGKRIFNQDIIEFGIDIINDENGAVLFHKVVCKVFLYPEPLSHVEERLDSDWDDNSSMNGRFSAYASSDNESVSTLSNSLVASPRTSSKSSSRFTSVTNDKLPSSPNQMRDKRLKELLDIEALIKDELAKSRKVESELLSIKQAVIDLNTVVAEDKSTDETERRLVTVESRLKSYDNKWQFQHAAIETAKKELQTWDNRFRQQGKQKEKLIHELEAERQKVKELELMLKQKRNSTFMSTRTLFGISIIVGLISIILFALYK